MILRAGTRTSRLARWQTHHVVWLLTRARPTIRVELVPFTTRGDRSLDQPLPDIGGKGLFTAELEAALLEGEIDIAVHSLKDLPTTQSPGVRVGAVTSRTDCRDTLVGNRLEAFPEGAVIGTSSPRRAAQILRMRPDLEVRSIRGNVPTRVEKVLAGRYDGAVLAAVGLHRLGMESHIAQVFEPDEVLPAPGQGAIAVHCRADDTQTLRTLSSINDDEAEATSAAERAFLARLQAGCSSPVGAMATLAQGTVSLTGAVFALDGSREIRVRGESGDAAALGVAMAEEALAQGAAEVLR